jgi:maltose O-acetyltransferase
MGIDEKAQIAALEEVPTQAPRPAPTVPPILVRLLGRGYVRPAIEAAAQQPRIWKYRLLSTCRRIHGEPVALQPVLFVGPGEIVLGDGVQFGWKSSPLFYTGYCHVETTTPDARIEIGDRTEFNNNLMIKSEGPGITIGKDGLFGANVEIFDSNFHDLHPERRKAGTQRMAPVEIGDNVFVGMGVKILKGVTIGHDSVIGAGSVVSSSIPAGVVAAGSPARVVREL